MASYTLSVSPSETLEKSVPLREVLAQQPVGVLVGAALPRVVRKREVEGRSRLRLDPPELGELLPPARRHRLHRRLARQNRDLDVSDGRLGVELGPAALEKPARAVDEHDEARPRGPPEDGIGLPAPEACARLGLAGPF